MPVKHFLAVALIPALTAFADEGRPVGQLDDPQSRIQVLKTVAEKVPFIAYESSQKSLFKNGDAVPEKFTPVSSARLDLEPYSGDWMPLKGSNFNFRPFQSLSVRLVQTPGVFAHPELLAPWVREMGENHLSSKWGEQDSSRPLTVIAKLSLMDQRLRATRRGSLDMGEVIEPGVKVPAEGSFQQRYFQARAPVTGLRYFYEPGVPEWWGFCDRLAVSNLQRNVHKLLKGFSGGFCGNVPFSRHDLEDSLSFFHPMPDAWKRHGVNRGNLTEPESLAAELMAWEEVTGQRPLGPDELIDLLAKNVKPGGKGLIIDEASLPADPFYSFDGIWNRPVFDYAISATSVPVGAAELSPLILARHGAWIAQQLALERPVAMEQAKDRAAAMAKESNARYNQWLGSVFRERALSTGFKTAEELPAMPPSRKTEDDYKESVTSFRNELKLFWSEVEDFSDTLDEKKDKAFTIEVKRVEVHFPRHRTAWDGKAATLFERNYHAVRIVHGKDATPWTWYAYHGDYPPDLAIVPEPIVSKNAAKLGKLLKDCVSIPTLETAVQRLSTSPSKTALKEIYASCAVRYLAKDAVAPLVKGFDGKQWDKAAAKCQAKWPDVAINAGLNDPAGEKYDFR